MHQQHEKTLLIHGFSPVNARLLTAYGTVFLCNNIVFSSPERNSGRAIALSSASASAFVAASALAKC